MNKISIRFRRREFLIASSMAVAELGALNKPRWACAAPTPDQPQNTKKIAAAITVYRKNSHADVILGKILSGWRHDGGDGPALQLVSLYVDQFPRDDLSKSFAAKHGFPIKPTIREAITLGTNSVAVDGVLSIGEHGDYPMNDKGAAFIPSTSVFRRNRCDFF